MWTDQIIFDFVVFICALRPIYILSFSWSSFIAQIHRSQAPEGSSSSSDGACWHHRMGRRQSRCLQPTSTAKIWMIKNTPLLQSWNAKIKQHWTACKEQHAWRWSTQTRKLWLGIVKFGWSMKTISQCRSPGILTWHWTMWSSFQESRPRRSHGPWIGVQLTQVDNLTQSADKLHQQKACIDTVNARKVCMKSVQLMQADQCGWSNLTNINVFEAI